MLQKRLYRLNPQTLSQFERHLGSARTAALERTL